MTRILITGINGQLGQELQRVLSSIENLEIIGVGRDRLDLSQPDRIRQIVTEIQPEIIINSGAYTAVDKAESESELAHLVNGVAPGIFAES
ncbi:MAG: sugar nucleotide-binding protein, partial [Geitlerinemataceae cyanobacterium]